MGFDRLSERFVSGLDKETKFSFTEYTFPALIDVCEKLARESVQKAGGRVEKDEVGEEFFVIPVQTSNPSALEQSWNPGPLSTNIFSEEELSQIDVWHRIMPLDGQQRPPARIIQRSKERLIPL